MVTGIQPYPAMDRKHPMNNRTLLCVRLFRHILVDMFVLFTFVAWFARRFKEVGQSFMDGLGVVDVLGSLGSNASGRTSWKKLLDPWKSVGVVVKKLL